MPPPDAPDECQARSCRVGGKALLLPLFGDDENSSSVALRVIIYTSLLVWCFLGVGMASDIFMGAIEKITSKRRRVLQRSTMTWKTVKVWNDTVANLTLMALGSSAPEILLSVIETVGNGFEAGQLGPSTIVGSAAFNLLVITAICVSCIPNGEIRAIEETQVFCITAAFSIFAYLWLAFIVSGNSMGVVETWESVITFLLFPILVLVAWLADKGYLRCSRKSWVRAASSAEEEASRKDGGRASGFTNLEMHALQKFQSSLPEEEILKLLDSDCTNKHSHAAYRVNNMKQLVRGSSKDLSSTPTKATQSLLHVPRCTVEFLSSDHAVLEGARHLDLAVCRRGPWPGAPVRVRYATRDGSAVAGKDYKPRSAELVFEKETDTEASISVEVIDNDAVCQEGSSFFHVELLGVASSQPAAQPLGHRQRAAGRTTTWHAGQSPSPPSKSWPSSPASLSAMAPQLELGPTSKALVRILDDDAPGKLKFISDSLEIVERSVDFEYPFMILRVGGIKGKVSCKYRTEDDTAVSGVDYEGVSGTLTFEHGQEHQILKVMIKSRGRFETSQTFRLWLEDPEGGATFCALGDGGESSAICTIKLTSDKLSQDRVDRLRNRLQIMSATYMVSHQKYWHQLVEAFQVRGDDEGGEEGEEEPLSVYEYCMHFVTLFWKLLFALVPPTDYCGGWLCFCASLIMIGALTAVIGDLASLLGCCLEIPDSITAITFVALGTSLPDTFASRTAAIQDPTADASVGNVTGSNSVNVFLGLGLPWLMASFYWERQGEAFEVVGGSLTFSVGVFVACAALCLAVLLLRRIHPGIGAELGGPAMYKVMTSVFFVLLWFAYVGLSAWEAMANKSPCD